MYNDITGIILSGGKSTRMGTNKSLLKLGDQTVIERIIDLMKPLFGRVILSTNSFDEYRFLGLEMFEDIYNGSGPLGGIHSGLVHSQTEKNFIISCDIPLMSAGIIKFLIEYSTDKPITIAKADGFTQQLCGVYSKSLLPEIEKIIEENITIDERNQSQQASLPVGKVETTDQDIHLKIEQKKRGCKVLQLVTAVDSEIIDIEKEYRYYVPGTFLNMNNPEEYEQLKNYFLKNSLTIFG